MLIVFGGVMEKECDILKFCGSLSL